MALACTMISSEDCVSNVTIMQRGQFEFVPHSISTDQRIKFSLGETPHCFRHASMVAPGGFLTSTKNVSTSSPTILPRRFSRFPSFRLLSHPISSHSLEP